ncbi:MAG: M20/M25/M40 family metallo-hydrolase, partial [Sedimentisphaerales bacterium]|nr:M20/M25/M40 family metallo-hydrolase [Sedimentisphaerales bacterium]
TIDYLRANCPDTVRLEVIRTEAPGRPLYFDPNQPPLRLAAAALTKGFGRECVFIREGGSIPVAETLSTHLQAPVLLMGLGLTTDGAHSPNECFKLDHLIKGAKSIATLMDSLAR